MTTCLGAIKYVLTPMGAPNPVKSNPISWAPFYLPVYPVGSTVGTLMCQDIPTENCPDHGPLVAGGAAQIDPAVYGDGVIGHDHLMAGPASGGDFNIAWEPILVLFTSKAAANTHLITKAQVDAAVASGAAFEVPLPQLTFRLLSGLPSGLRSRHAAALTSRTTGVPRVRSPLGTPLR